jgi:actin-like ATPase involved in cell morphogenesis
LINSTICCGVERAESEDRTALGVPTRLTQVMTCAIRRRLMDTLVESVVIEREWTVRVRYRFAPIVIHADIRGENNMMNERMLAA